MEQNTAVTTENGLVTSGNNGNYSQFLDPTGGSIDMDEGKVRYRVRQVENQLTSGWVYSQELSFPFPRSGVDNATNLPVINGDDGSTSDVIEGLQVVNKMGYFDRIDLKWDRDSYCSDGDGSLCDTMSQPSTYAVDVIDTGATAPVIGDGATADWDFLTDTISASRPRYVHHSSASEGATMLVSDETRHYRVFPVHAGRYGYPLVVEGKTKLASVPGRIPDGGLRVTANGDTKLDLDWNTASHDGGSPVTGYIIQVSQDRDNNDARLLTASWCDVAHQEVSDPPVAADREYTYDGDIRNTGVMNCADPNEVAPLTKDGEALAAGYGRWFRVIPLNKNSTDLNDDVNTSWTIDDDSANAVPAFGRTGQAAGHERPGAPIGLVAETALNVHSTLTTDKGVLLTWDVPAETGTGDITDYVVRVSVDGGAWSTLEDGESTVTDWTHSDPLPTTTEERAYQVAAVNSVGMGPWSNMAHYSTMSMTDPDHMHPPTTAALTAPTNVMAMSDAAGELTLTWEGADAAELYVLLAVDLSSVASGTVEYERMTITDGGESGMGDLTDLV